MHNLKERSKVFKSNVFKMTIAMADKLVTKFRFTEKKKKKEGLNSVFIDFIICRLTETTVSKSRDV